MTTDIAFQDYLAIGNVAFDWAESYDTKDWDRLRRCLAPSVRMDYRNLRGDILENLTPDEYVAIISHPKKLGSKLLKSQHLLGASKWQRLDDGAVSVEYQIRAAHQLYTSAELHISPDGTTEPRKGHGHASIKLWFRRVDGDWKLEGVNPQLDWIEYDFFGLFSSLDE